MPSTTAYLVIGLVAAVATFVCTPLVGWFARRIGWVVEPDERRVHTVATPDVGGIAMFIGFVAALAAARLNDHFDPLFARNAEPRGVLLAASLMFLVGLIDDIREISAPAKVVGTVAVAGVLTYYGVTMFYFRVPFVDVFMLSDDWIPLITVVWLLGMTQAINLIDGLDGLAAGIVAIGALAFFLYSLRLADPNVRLLSLAQHRPADRDHHRRHLRRLPAAQLQPGADLHGRRWRAAARVCCWRSAPASSAAAPTRTCSGYAGQTYFFLAPLFIPLFILGVPILDTLFAIIRARDAAPGRGHGRQGAPPPPADGDGPRPAAQRGDPVGVDRAAVGVRAVPGAHAELRVATSRSAPQCWACCCTPCLHPQIRRNRSHVT